MKKPGTPTRTPFRPSAIARGSGPRPTPMPRKRRTVSEFNRIYGSKKRVAWVKSLACCYCKAPAPSHNAHTETGGMGRKAGASTIAPLCARCHRAYDEYRPPFHTTTTREFVKGAASMVEELWQARLATQAAA